MSFEELMSLLRSRFSWIAGGTLAGVLVGAALAFLTTPVYRASTVLAPVDDQTAGSSLMQVAGDLGRIMALPALGNGGSIRAEAIATLRSHKLVANFITQNELLPVLFADRWDPAAARWNDDPPTINEGVELWLEDLLVVSEDRRSGLVTAAVEWSDPIVAAYWVNGLVDSVNSAMRSRAMEEAARTREFLESELQSTAIVGVQQGIHRLIESNLNQAVLASVRRDYAFRIVDPAVAVDPDQFVRPRRALLLFLGVVVGLAVSSLIVVANHRGLT